MALIQADRVRETSSTTGSANFSLVGAVDGFQRFSAAIGSANTCYYAATDGSAFEVGLGTVSANTLARTTIFNSSHTSSGTIHRVNFQSGTKDIFATYVADKSVILDTDGDLTLGTTADISTLGNVSVAKTLTITSGVSGASTLNVKGAVSAGSTLGVKGNVSSEGTLSVIGAVSVGATLGVTNNASITGTFTFATASSTGNLDVAKNFSVIENVSVGGTLGVKSNASITGTLAVTDEFNFATANSTGNLGVVGNASIGGTLLVDGNSFTFNTASTSGTLTVGDNFSAKSTSRFGDEAIFDSVVSVGGTFHIQGNASAQGTLNVKGAVTVAATVEGTALSDGDGNLRDIPKSRTFADTTVSAAQTDTGNFIFLTSSDQTVVIPTASGTFDTGDIFSVVCAGASATISSNISLMFKVGEASATATITLGANKIASVLFVSPQHAYVSGT
jgi:hypothetical protein